MAQTFASMEVILDGVEGFIEAVDIEASERRVRTLCPHARRAWREYTVHSPDLPPRHVQKKFPHGVLHSSGRPCAPPVGGECEEGCSAKLSNSCRWQVALVIAVSYLASSSVHDWLGSPLYVARVEPVVWTTPLFCCWHTRRRAGKTFSSRMYTP